MAGLRPRSGSAPNVLPVLIRRIAARDIDAVFEMWSARINEATGAPPLSFDRWGPGVAVPADGSMSAAHIPPEPSIVVRRHLTSAIDHPASACFVAEQHDVLAGFITCCWLAHPTKPGRSGQVEEVYVRPDVRRHRVGTQLLEHALAYLRDQEAAVFKAEIDSGDRAAAQFFRQFGWIQEHTLLTIHD